MSNQIHRTFCTDMTSSLTCVTYLIAVWRTVWQWLLMTDCISNGYMWQDKENAILLGVLTTDLVNYASNNWMKETSRRETLYMKWLPRSRETLLDQSIFCGVKMLSSLQYDHYFTAVSSQAWFCSMMYLAYLYDSAQWLLDIGKWQRFWWFLHDQMPAQNKCLGYCLVVKCAISVGNLLLNKCLWYWVTAGQVCQLLVCQHLDWCVDWSVSM